MLILVASLLVSTFFPSGLKCESLVDPLGMDVARPRLSWIVESTQMGQRQTAYRILVASNATKLKLGKADLWDSGKVRSSLTRDIPYAGRKLQSSERVFWNVRVWDMNGKASPPSPTQTWTMGLLSPADWKAKWIGAIDRPLPRLGIGYHALEDKLLNDTKWVQVDLGAVVPIQKIILHPVRDHLGYPLFGFPSRFRVEAASEPTFRNPVSLSDHDSADYTLTEPSFKVDVHGTSARYVRVTATKLFPRKDGVGCFALAELEVDSNGKNVAVGKKATALDSVERDGWTLRALTDSAGVQKDPAITILLRKDFQLPKKISRAICYVSGLGQYELHINGKKIGQDWSTPGWTQYAKTVLADTYDVTGSLRTGVNAVALHIGNGMYNMETDTRGSQQTNSLGTHKAICQIRVEYADGSVATLATDQTWRWAPSPETYSGVFGGEDWDARLEQKGWDSAGFNDTAWKPALAVTPPKGVLRGITHAAPPIRVIETRKSIHSTTPKANLLVLDLGQNAPYVPQIVVKGPAGTAVRMWPAEILKPDGTVEQQTMRAGKYCTYTLKGGSPETWHPIFWYVGSRYWQIDAHDADGKQIDPHLVVKDFTGLLVHSSAKPTGDFECSNTLFNQIYSLIHWAIRSNLSSVISDCPHREKSGWLEEDHLNGPGLMYCYDMTNLFRKVVEDMHDTQLPNGMVPTMAPEYFIYDGGFRDSVEWGGTYLFLPRYMRDWYADKGLVWRHYESMKRYVDYLGTLTKNDILSTGLGDWTGYGNDERTPVGITDTAYYYSAIVALTEFANAHGEKRDVQRYTEIGERVKARFNAEYFSRATGKIGTGSQSGQATALDLGLVDPADRAAVFAQLLKDVEAHDYAVSCGEVGHPSLLRSLAAFGRSDLVAKIHLQTEKPGYGYQIKKGMTTLTEAWDASPISLNHFMMGHLMEWLYADLAGIKPDPLHPGFTNVIFQPTPVSEVTWAKAHYDSIHGRITSDWKTEGDRMTLDVDIPANCTGTVYLPAAYSTDFHVVERATGKRVVPGRVKATQVALTLPSGQFRVTSASR